MTKIKLIAANGTPIKSFGYESRQIKIGDKCYVFSFIIADIVRPILGIDFLKHYGMLLDLKKGELVHSGIATPFSSTSSTVAGVNLVRDWLYRVQHILDEFPELTDVSRATTLTKHGVKCHVKTTGLPIRTAPRRLTAEKLDTARKYFQMMCTAGICHMSNSAWSSGLHMVPKKDGTWRPCGDYRRLNNATVMDSYPLPHIHECTARLAGQKSSVRLIW